MGVGVAGAQTICVRESGREACLVHTTDPLTGAHAWAIWTDNFRQYLVLEPDPPGIYRFKLTSFERMVGDSARGWCQGGPFAGEYELQYGWAAGSMTLVLDGPNWEDSLAFVDAAIGQGEQDGIAYVQLAPRFRHISQPLEIRLFYRAYLDGYLERWARVTNTAASDTTLYIDHLASARRQLSPAGWLPGGDSRWEVEYIVPGHTAWLDSLDVPEYPYYRVLRSWPQSPAPYASLAWCAVRYDSRCDKDWCRQEGFINGLVQASGAQEWPNLTQLARPQSGVGLDLKTYNVERTQSTDLDREEEEEDRAEILPQVVPPGQSAEGSHVYFMFTNGTIDDATLKTHRFMRNHYAPAAPFPADSMPRVQFLTYFWNDWGFTYATLSQQADVCEGLGVELFVIDANWWPYSLYNPPPTTDFNCYRRGNGYWVSDACRFPEPDSTLPDFMDELEHRGMDAGLWVYPCSVDSVLLSVDSLACWSEDPPVGSPCFCDSAGTLVCSPWHSIWYTAYGHGDWWENCLATSQCPTTTGQSLGELCCAHAPAREWMKGQLRRLLEEDCYGARYLKFDGGIHPCISTSHGHRMALEPGDSLRVQSTLLGYYQMLEELRQEFPEVTFESSWPVGHVASGEDADPAEMLPRMSRYSMESLRCAFPPRYTGCFLYREPDVTGLDQSERLAVRRHYARTPMLGPYTISSDVTIWSVEFRAVVAEAIDYYQANRRFLQGEVYNILTQRSLCNSSLASCPDSWDAVEFVDPDVGDARVFVFRNEADEDTQTIILQGLVPAQQYSVTGVDQGDYGTYTGTSLMTTGIEVKLEHETSSEILEIE